MNGPGAEATLSYALLVLFYAGSAYGWFRRTGSLFHPTVVHSLSWLLPIAWHWAYSDEFAPISASLALLLASASVAFFVPFAPPGPAPALSPRPVSLPRLSGTTTAALVGVFLLPLVSLVLAIQLVGSVSDMALVTLRESFVGEAHAPSIGIGIIFPVVMGAAFYVWNGAASRPLKILAGVSAVVMAVLSTSKIYFFILLSLMLVRAIEEPPGVVVKRLVKAAVLGLAAFMLLHLALGKFIGAESVVTTGDMLRAAMLTLAIYFGGSISTLDMELSFRNQLPDGYLYLDFPWLAKAIGTPMATDEKILPFVFIPELGANVFSGYAPVLHEFGFLGVVLFMLLLGILYSALYEGSTDPGGRFLYGFALFPLVFLFHNEFFLMSANMWIGFVFVSWALSWKLAADRA
jgi:oligosaccharide repeat unit polymerase